MHMKRKSKTFCLHVNFFRTKPKYLISNLMKYFKIILFHIYDCSSYAASFIFRRTLNCLQQQLKNNEKGGEWRKGMHGHKIILSLLFASLWFANFNKKTFDFFLCIFIAHLPQTTTARWKVLKWLSSFTLKIA